MITWTAWKNWIHLLLADIEALDLIVDWFPQLRQMKNCEQDPRWHPEGGVWVHTKLVVKAGFDICTRDNITNFDREAIIIACLCHDMGKPYTTFERKNVDGSVKIVSPGHAEHGVQKAEKFLWSVGAPHDIIETVGPLVAEHMAYLNCYTEKAMRRLLKRLEPATFEQLIAVIEADHSGRPPLPKRLPEKAIEMERLYYNIFPLQKDKPNEQNR
jgi:tRNA nucleotidyltransferase (CCA-adding enzyme)